jgi:predicted nucleic acid-binding protein
MKAGNGRVVSMQEKNSACCEGVVDVSILVPACFENPLKDYSIEFLSEVLRQEKKALIPVSTVLGAYHINTRYLRVPRVSVKKILQGILDSGSPALYPYISTHAAIDALDYASTYNIESWDGYLIALARSQGATIVYSLDRELSKVREIAAVNPFPQKIVKQYHSFLNSRIK